MQEPYQNAANDFQKMGKDNYETMVRSYRELNKGLQAIATRWTVFSKDAFEDATRTFEKLVGVKSFEQAVEIQSAYAKRAYENWVAEATKIGEMYADVARETYKPVEKAVAKKVA
jgi:hypothetical protein